MCLPLGGQIQEYWPELVCTGSLHKRKVRAQNAFSVELQSKHKCAHLPPFPPSLRTQQSQKYLALKLLSSKAVAELRSQKMKDFFLDLPSNILG